MLDGDGDHGTWDSDVSVLGVLALEQRPGSLVFLPMVDNPAMALGADPPQFGPVVVIVVDEHRSCWVPTQVLESLKLQCRFRLGIDGRLDRVPVENETARHDMGSSVGPDGRQMGDLGRRCSFSHHLELHGPTLPSSTCHDRALLGTAPMAHSSARTAWKGPRGYVMCPIQAYHVGGSEHLSSSRESGLAG